MYVQLRIDWALSYVTRDGPSRTGFLWRVCDAYLADSARSCDQAEASRSQLLQLMLFVEVPNKLEPIDMFATCRQPIVAKSHLSLLVAAMSIWLAS